MLESLQVARVFVLCIVDPSAGLLRSLSHYSDRRDDFELSYFFNNLAGIFWSRWLAAAVLC